MSREDDLEKALIKVIVNHCEFRRVSGTKRWTCMTHFGSGPDCALTDVFNLVRTATDDITTY